MKVKNIAFSGFAAAILGGVCGATDANAIQLVSPEYVAKQLETKQNVLTEGTGIKIEGNVISSTVSTDGFATMQDVTDAIEDVTLTMGDYATKQELADKQDKLNAGSGVTIDELTNTISADTTVVATKAAVEELAAKVPDAGAVSESDVANKIAESLADYTKTENLATVAKTGQYSDLLGLPTLITQDDLTNLQSALQTEIAKKQDAGDFATSTQLQNLSTELSNFKDNVYTKEEVDQALADAVTNGTINLDGYATVQSLNDLKNSLKAVATTGSYNDLTDKPTIPTTVAELTDAGNYALKSELPTKTSQLTNDSGFITGADADLAYDKIGAAAAVKTAVDDSKYISGVGAAGNYIVHLDGNGNVTWKAVEVIGEDGKDMLAQ